ncbi:hypothetical protein GobsT_03000 [Gemmata obscuriglobus]|uniref:DUF1109 domain-containing protein n=1 Tax=Gemmata obscuriglobus TaxID=114 RepID=A0A2Z3H9I9_9BACT|nr:hypothetical protein C1280_31650 [Gemmata obscuriglobus]QEG25573.1 hypothetical protein GobsT_03000 [Gemmata obscuriglobus]VTR98989.1 unnamed protein product [Gemmata obscuriglobus UQM 2246]
MRVVILVAGCVWVAVALAGVSNTHTSMDLGFALLFTGFALTVAWGAVTLRSQVRRGRVWWSLPPAVLVVAVLAMTEWGLVARVWLSEAPLRARAEAARRGEVDHRSGRTGLFFIQGVEEGRSEVRFVTGSEMLDTVGLAHREVPPGPGERHYRHLFGPWYRFVRPY